MNSLVWLGRVLEASVRRKGEVPITNAHLLNIVNMALRAEANHAEQTEKRLAEVIGEDKKWGSD